MKRFLLSLVILSILVSCAGNPSPAQTPKTTDQIVASLKSAKTVNAAEESFYVAVKAYELAMTQINRAYARGSIGNARYTEILATAGTFRTASLGVFNALQFWRDTANRHAFDDQAAKAAAALQDLIAAAGSSK